KTFLSRSRLDFVLVFVLYWSRSPLVLAECGFVLLLMAIYWITEVIPLSMTAMLPAILFPLCGIMSSSNVAKEYFNNFHFLLVGVVCLATSIEKWGLHRRVALRLVTLVGVNPAWLLLGFMSGCAFLSMWVQNTSAVTMVMPIVDAVLKQILKANEEGYSGEDNPTLELDGTCTDSILYFIKAQNIIKSVRYTEPDVPTETFTSVQIPAEDTGCQRGRMLCKAMCIGIAYSSNIGGITTLPGTSPNLIFAEHLNRVYPDCNSINFANWLLLCLPISVIMLLMTWLWLYWIFIGSDFKFLWQCRGEQSERERAVKKVLEDEYKKLGAIRSQEIFTGVVFVVMVLLWLTRSPGFIPGWASLFPHKSNYITDATVALVLGVLLFIVPAHGPSRKYESMISWKEFQASMPWQVALMVSGGFALAKGAEESGLSLWLARLMTPLGDLPVLATVTVACLLTTTLTEVASNAATITIFLPILSPLAEAIHVNPLYILIPATLCTSFSFLLPVSNPPGAVVYGYGHFTTLDMVKAGLGVNTIGVLAVLLAMATWGIPLFSLDTYPDWAPTFNSTTP
uniref:Solute carrier family 13 member 1 n=1 Tax=Astatotilapia calliptera TaxID=8154 RepID=A0AAX7TFZ1_ASTCA